MGRAIVLAGILLASAVSLAPAPAAAGTDIHIGIQIVTPPQLVVIPGTPVYQAPAVPYNYFFYGGQFYLFRDGAWYYAPTHNGPWASIAVEYVPRPILAVPVEYYKVPPGHWKRKGPPPWAPAWGHRKKGEDEDD